MIYLHGMKVIKSQWLGPITKRIQFRHPKSKNRRIRKKWSKRKQNFKEVTEDKCIHDTINNVIIMSEANYHRLLKQTQII